MTNTNRFAELPISEEIKKALALMHYDTMTEVQVQAIPEILQHHDLTVQAQTGSGKTAAYGIPICHEVDWEENAPQALILTPTRELAMQVQTELSNIGKFRRIKVAALYGKHSFQAQERTLRQKTHIVAGTPGRVLDHLNRGTLNAGNIGWLIIDEADEMFHMGFIDAVEEIISYLPEERTTLLFSATMPKQVVYLAEEHQKSPKQIQIQKKEVGNVNVSHGWYSCDEEEKTKDLLRILKKWNPDSCMVFCNMRTDVEKVYDALWDDGFSCARLHGGMEQWERTEVMRDFRKGRFRYLVSTDVAARGIDVDNIELVVNYDFPTDTDVYIHRSGRTGRAGRTGQCISLLTIYDTDFMERLQRRLTTGTVEELALPTEEEMPELEAAFRAKMDAEPEEKAQKHDALLDQVMKLQIDDGRKAKIRPVDIVGTICAIPGVEAKDIGVIQIMDWISTVEILNGKGDMVRKALQTKPIKAKIRKVTKAKYQD